MSARKVQTTKTIGDEALGLRITYNNFTLKQLTDIQEKQVQESNAIVDWLTTDILVEVSDLDSGEVIPNDELYIDEVTAITKVIVGGSTSKNGRSK